MSSNQQRLVPFIVAALGYAVKFTAYGILTAAVLMTFAALMFVYITLVGPEVPFIRYLSFVLPVDARGNASINGDDIMRVYGLFTLVLFGLSVAGGWLVRIIKRTARRIFQPEAEDASEESSVLNQNPLSSAKRRLLVSSIVITVIYLIVFIAIPSARMAEGTSNWAMYPIFVVFYIIAMISNAIYIGIDSLSDLMLGWGWSKALGG